MGAKRISQLSELTGLTLDDIIVIVHSGTTYQTTINELAQIFPINGAPVNNEEGGYFIPLVSGRTLVNSLLHQTSGYTIHVGTIDESQVNEENLDRFGVYAGETVSYNLVSLNGNIDNYLQLNVKNLNTGSTASTDIVCTSDVGTETESYVNMGINSSSYNGFIGEAGDAYLFSKGNNIYIGNAASGPYYDLLFFNGGEHTPDHIKMRITALDGHTIYGNLLISGTATITNQLVIPEVINLNYPDDATAEAAGVALGGIYHTDGVLKIRLPDPVVE